VSPRKPERGQEDDDTQDRCVPLNNTSDGDHNVDGAHDPLVVAGDQQDASAEVGHGCTDTQSRSADPADALLLILADGLDDLEKLRIAQENRLRSLTTIKGLAQTDQAAVEQAAIVDGLIAMEARAIKSLEKAMKAHPLGPWVNRTVGIGLKQAGRLLATIGDPAWNATEDRPRRGPAELWQFCGHGDPERSKLRKGQKVEHSPQAKMRTRLIAMSVIKQVGRTGAAGTATKPTELSRRPSPYRAVYDQARAHWRETRPDATDGHSHSHGLRVVGKAVLRDLYRESLALDQKGNDTRPLSVGG
jgi:hypothetical protein